MFEGDTLPSGEFGDAGRAAPPQMRDRVIEFRERFAEAARGARAVLRAWGAGGGAHRVFATAAILAALSVGLGYVGPFGTFGVVPLGERIAYWAVSLTLGAATWEGLFAAARRLWPAGRDGMLLPWATGPVFALVGAMETSALQALFGWSSLDRAIALWPTYAVGWLVVTLLAVLPIFTVIHVSLAARGRAAARADAQAAEADATSAADPADPAGAAASGSAAGLLLSRTPRARTLQDIVALEAQDHYVRVHSRRGADLVLIRFEDALEAVAGVRGARVHRSWWVAAAAVERLEADRARCVGGLDVPISRRRRAAAVAALAALG